MFRIDSRGRRTGGRPSLVGKSRRPRQKECAKSQKRTLVPALFESRRNGAPQGSIRYVVFPHSHKRPPWPYGAADIKITAQAALRDAGGWAAVDKLY